MLLLLDCDGAKYGAVTLYGAAFQQTCSLSLTRRLPLKLQFPEGFRPLGIRV
jgi:hypothetical protein